MVKMNIEWGDNHSIHGDEVIVEPVDGRIISAILRNIYGHYEPINLGTFDWMELPGRLRTHIANMANMISSFAMLGTPHHDDATIAPEWAWAMWEELNEVVVSSRQVADSFDKEHRNILRTIEDTIGMLNFERANKMFHKTTYEHPQNH